MRWKVLYACCLFILALKKQKEWIQWEPLYSIQRQFIMVVIRLASPGGRKKYPFRHIVVADKRTKRDSFIEKLGYFDPIRKQLHINTERYQYWLTQGAHVNPKGRTKQLFKQWINQPQPDAIATTTVDQHADATH
jgi:small subunit ribosomal protein S16